ncbi:P-type cation-transporting ATPase [Apiospora kogelbergensis]|uniref:P-type cation-transporting ATPase n=1 Tax=Apiospora kogelbergensis TaxID=1337665 RepID=A0AAW0R2N5_9PEZI
MACGSGCCGSPAPAPPEQSSSAMTPVGDDGDSCCSDDAVQVSDKNPDPPTSTDAAHDGKTGGCCSAPKPAHHDDTPAPPCCEGKAAPCCDQSCLDRIAQREGGSTSSDRANKTHLTPVACPRAPRPPVTTPAAAPGRHRRAPRSSADASRASADSCCAASGVDATAGGCSAKKRPRSKKGRRGSCGLGARPPTLGATDSCVDACCAGERPDSHASEAKGPESPRIRAVDLEQAFAGNEMEHVILSISGMTCTGCETKLVRILGTHPRVRNLKASLVLSRAEFDVTGAASAAEVMKHLERTTEFKCERITNQGSSLDLIAPGGDAAAFVNQPWPGGVTEVRAVNKKTVNVSFDAKAIGARDLVKHGWGNGQLELAPLRPDPSLEAGSRQARHVGYTTLLSVCLTIPVMIMAWAPLPKHDIAYASASLALATIVQFAIAGPFYPKALKSFIFSRIIEMDLLIVLSTSTAYIFSIVSFAYHVSGQPLSTGEFFETSTLLVTLIMVGRWVSAFTRQKAIESISIRSLQTPTALLVQDDGETEIDARLLQYGDVFKVAPDSRIPTDGTVISGSSEVDESLVTGESRPVEKHAKHAVIAGSVNGSGMLLVRLTRLPGENTISAIAKMVDEAKLSKPKIQDLADRVASYFVPVVITLTTITLVVWVAIGVAVRQQPANEAAIQAITYAIAVLIVSCPCAIGLAVPMVVVIASGVAAERGVIFKSAESIEVAYKTTHVVLDKTGTITEGKLSVAREWYTGSDQNATKSLLLGLVGSIKHPVSVAVATHLKAQGVSPSPVSEPKALTGKGVEGAAEESGVLLQAGNSRWLNLGSDPEVQSMLSQGYTTFCFTVGSSVAAVFGLDDSIRPDAAPTIKTLLERGISVHIISGDDEGAVRSVGAKLNVAKTNIRSRCTPSDKQKYIQVLLEDAPSPGRTARGKKPVVLFCGDGTNDAVALAQATIGVHMHEGAPTWPGPRPMSCSRGPPSPASSPSSP